MRPLRDRLRGLSRARADVARPARGRVDPVAEAASRGAGGGRRAHARARCAQVRERTGPPIEVLFPHGRVVRERPRRVLPARAGPAPRHLARQPLPEPLPRRRPRGGAGAVGRPDARGVRPPPRGLPRHRDDRPQRRRGNRRVPGRRRLRPRRPVRGPPVRHARLRGRGRAARRAGRGPARLPPPGDVQRPRVRHPAARDALSALPHALPAGARGPPRPAGAGPPAVEGAARVLPAAEPRAVAPVARAAGGRAGRGDPAHLLRLREAARRPRARARARAQPARRRLAGRRGRAGERVGARGPRRGPARRVQPRPRVRGRAALRAVGGAVPARDRPGDGAAAGPVAGAPRARQKRRGDHQAALRLWSEAAAAGSARGWRELAVHHEHRGRDLPAALDAADRGLRAIDGATTRDLAADLQRRRARLLRRLRPAPQASSACR